MTTFFKKVTAVVAISLALLGAPKKSEAGIGVISLIGGPAGVPIIIAGAGLAIGGTAVVLGTCYVGMKLADWSQDCPIFINLTFWPGLLLLNAGEENKLAADIMAKYGADQESADRIADRFHNKALRSLKEIAKTESSQNAGEAVVVQVAVSLSAEELSELVSDEFAASNSFQQLVRDYE